ASVLPLRSRADHFRSIQGAILLRDGHSVRKLLRLALEGIATHAMEALPSYLIRLAAAHGLTVGGLFDHLKCEHPDWLAAGAAFEGQPLATYVRTNTTTERPAALLAAAGCDSDSNLSRATFLYLSEVLA